MGILSLTSLLTIVVAIHGSIKFDHRIVSFRKRQAEHDRLFRPFARPNPNTLTESSPVGNFTLKSLIHVGNFSSVYTVHETRQFLIKYQCNCAETANINPLLRDAWFSEMATELGISARIFFVSPPEPLPVSRTRKMPFTMTDEKWLSCLRNGGEVRYMVMERIMGETILEIQLRKPRGMIELHHALAILDNLNLHLMNLHDLDIVHGDIHAGNVMLSTDAKGNRKMHVIDYGEAFFSYPNESNEPICTVGEWTHELTSPWQIMGQPWGKRDDMYRALDLFARMINGPEWLSHVRNLTQAGHMELLKWRLTGDLFTVPRHIPTLVDPFATNRLNVLPITVSAIKTKLKNILNLVRGLDDINQPLPYEEVHNIINEIIALLKGAVST